MTPFPVGALPVGRYGIVDQGLNPLALQVGLQLIPPGMADHKKVPYMIKGVQG